MKTLAIVGATGAVGEEVLAVLAKRKIPIAVRLLASARSAGKRVAFAGTELVVEELTENSFAGIDFAIFSAGGDISKKFAPIAAATGCVVIDNSSAFRMDPTVPLIIPAFGEDHFFYILCDYVRKSSISFYPLPPHFTC